MTEIIIDDRNFETEVMQSEIPVLIDFFATWCGPCRMLAPIIEELAEKNAGKIKVGKIDVDRNPALAAKFGVESIPTVVVMKGGKLTATSVGYRSKEQIEALLTE